MYAAIVVCMTPQRLRSKKRWPSIASSKRRSVRTARRAEAWSANAGYGLMVYLAHVMLGSLIGTAMFAWLVPGPCAFAAARILTRFTCVFALARSPVSTSASASSSRTSAKRRTWKLTELSCVFTQPTLLCAPDDFSCTFFLGLYVPPFGMLRIQVESCRPQSLYGTPLRPVVQSTRGSTVILAVAAARSSWLPAFQ